MSRTQRRIGLLFLFALVLSPLSLFAQDDNISAAGSAAVAPVLNALIERSGSPQAAAINVSITGTNTGIDLFCRGEVDIALANRAITPGDEAACANSAVSYLEILAGYDGIALIANPVDNLTECLTSADLRLIYAPGSTGLIVNWTQINPELPFQPLTLVVPNANTAAYNILNGLVGTGGLREDLALAADDAAVIAQVSETPGALGIVRLGSANSAGDAVRVLEYNTGEAGCLAPTLENINAGLYGGAQPLFFYVNADNLSKPGLTETLNVLADVANSDVFVGLGLIAPSEDDFAGNTDVLTNLITGRQFSGADTSFNVPTSATGQVLIAGSPSGLNLLSAWTSVFASAYPTVTATPTLLGEPDGFARLCNGEVDLVVAYNNLPDAEVENCSLNNIVVTSLELGKHAVGLIANAQSDYLTCLTTAELATTWGAASENTITTWNQVREGLPETAITLFAPSTRNLYTDVLLLQSGATPAVDRADTADQNDDSGYRAAATANVEGALGYYDWADFVTVTASDQANIASVSVDGGSGCIAPSEATIADGTYPLARPVKLLINRAALARQDVQALLWFIAQDANYSIIQSAGLVGLPISAVPELRASLETLFTEATAEVAQAAVDAAAQAESTPEPGAEATPNAEAT
ncbi:MAG: substrate-binding domain-containing protein, partial [Chloroflexota bacterium]|nr:substrate-binding domain-containing protein [Chloroflexota bacterium]